MARGRDHFTDLAMFPRFDGFVSHTAHIDGYDSIHLLWRSVPV